MNETLQQVMGLLAIAMIVAMLARRLQLLYTIGLVLVGGLLAWSGTQRLPPLTSELLYYLILPPLLFGRWCSRCQAAYRFATKSGW